MQYIDVNLPNIIEARDTHYQFMKYIIKKKLNGPGYKDIAPLTGMNKIKQIGNIRSLNPEVIAFLNDEINLKNVLIGLPDVLDTIKLHFTDPAQIETIKKILNYDSWIVSNKKNSTYREYNAYHLAEKLDIPTCVYCNRMYTKTVIKNNKKKITRPTFDHWFTKSKYPLLALSFYNLIPSCSVCNSSVKGSVIFTLDRFFHPYYKHPQNDLKYAFSYDHINYNKFSFKINTNSGDEFSKRSVEAFELESIYKAHQDEIEDLRHIKDAYSESYIEMLESKVLKLPLDRKDVYRLAFGVHYDESKFDRRPLSKMKRDILTELGIKV